MVLATSRVKSRENRLDHDFNRKQESLPPPKVSLPHPVTNAGEALPRDNGVISVVRLGFCS